MESLPRRARTGISRGRPTPSCARDRRFQCRFRLKEGHSTRPSGPQSGQAESILIYAQLCTYNNMLIAATQALSPGPKHLTMRRPPATLSTPSLRRKVLTWTAIHESQGNEFKSTNAVNKIRAGVTKLPYHGAGTGRSRPPSPSFSFSGQTGPCPWLALLSSARCEYLTSRQYRGSAPYGATPASQVGV